MKAVAPLCRLLDATTHSPEPSACCSTHKRNLTRWLRPLFLHTVNPAVSPSPRFASSCDKLFAESWEPFPVGNVLPLSSVVLLPMIRAYYYGRVLTNTVPALCISRSLINPAAGRLHFCLRQSRGHTANNFEVESVLRKEVATCRFRK